MEPLRLLLALATFAVSRGAVNSSSLAVSYNEDLAIALSLYSSAAYCAPDQVQAWTLSPTCTSALSAFKVTSTYAVNAVGPFSNNKGFAYIGVDTDRELVIASFKGSNDTADWIEDIEGLEFNFRSCTLASGTASGTVHNGFCSYFVGLADLGLTADFVALAGQYPTFTPVVTGHSLGAAAAVLMAYDVYGLSNGAVKPTLYTYGQPRVGDYTFSQELAEHVTASYRVTHWRDVVPHLPFACPSYSTSRACPYQTETEVFYTEDSSSYTICDGSGEDPECSDQFGIKYSSSDHCSYFESATGGICGACCN